MKIDNFWEIFFTHRETQIIAEEYNKYMEYLKFYWVLNHKFFLFSISRCLHLLLHMFGIFNSQ